MGDQMNSAIDDMEKNRDIHGLNRYISQYHPEVSPRAIKSIFLLARDGIGDISSVEALNGIAGQPIYDDSVRLEAIKSLWSLSEYASIGDISSVRVLQNYATYRELGYWSMYTVYSLAKQGIIDASSADTLSQLFHSQDLDEKAKKMISWTINTINSTPEEDHVTSRSTPKLKEFKKSEAPVPTGESPFDTQQSPEDAKQVVSPVDRADPQKPLPQFDSLDSLVTFQIPQFIDSGTTHEIIINIENKSLNDINSLQFDFSDMALFFEIQQELSIRGIRRGLKLTKRLKLAPMFEEGSFPVEIKINADGAEFNRKVTIKVGGTEIY